MKSVFSLLASLTLLNSIGNLHKDNSGNFKDFQGSFSKTTLPQGPDSSTPNVRDWKINGDGTISAATSIGFYASGDKPGYVDTLDTNDVLAAASYSTSKFAIVKDQTGNLQLMVRFVTGTTGKWLSVNKTGDLTGYTFLNASFFTDSSGVMFFAKSSSGTLSLFSINASTLITKKITDVNVSWITQAALESRSLSFVFKSFYYPNSYVKSNVLFGMIKDPQHEFLNTNTLKFLKIETNTKYFDNESNWKTLTIADSFFDTNNVKITSFDFDNSDFKSSNLYFSTNNGMYLANYSDIIAAGGWTTDGTLTAKNKGYHDITKDIKDPVINKTVEDIVIAPNGSIIMAHISGIDALWAKDITNHQITDNNWKWFGKDNGIDQGVLKSMYLSNSNSSYSLTIFSDINTLVPIYYTNSFILVPQEDDENDNSSLVIGLSVGLGVGIPVFLFASWMTIIYVKKVKARKATK